MPRFHIALGCGFYVDAKTINLKQMDIAMIPHGEKHWIADNVNSELIASERARDICALGMSLFQQGEVTNKIMFALNNKSKWIQF